MISIRYGFSVIVFTSSLVISTASIAYDISGYLGADVRYFPHDPLFDGQSDDNGSLTGNIEIYHDFDNDLQRIAFTAQARIDSEDDERSHLDFRELYWWKNYSAVEVYMGIRKVFWGVTESVHLVDIINQTDNLENVDGEDKLGQPMVELVSAQDWGTISAYVLPYFREQEFVGIESRLRPEVAILDEAAYQSGAEEKHIDLAIRWSHYFDIWDIGISHFSGTARQPIFLPQFENDDFIGLRPFYNQVEQSGIDIQATVDAWLIKLEAISIDEKIFGRNTAAAGGIEYSFFSVGGSEADLGVVVEYQFDDRTGPRQTIAQNDIVLGVRWAFNDLDGSEILALISQDLDYQNRFFSIELSRRLNDDWKVEAEARVFSSLEPETTEYDFRDDDYFQIELRRYF